MLQENTFSRRLQSKRIEMGLSQIELAKRIGVSRSLYNKYERAGIEPSHETLVLLANELGTTVDYLVGKIDKSPLGEKRESSTPTGEEALQILANERSLSKKDIEYLKETIRILEENNRVKEFREKMKFETGKDVFPKFS